jgi:hypothetical protein
MSIIQRKTADGYIKIDLNKVVLAEVKEKTGGDGICFVNLLMESGSEYGYEVNGDPELLIRDFIMEV